MGQLRRFMLQFLFLIAYFRSCSSVSFGYLAALMLSTVKNLGQPLGVPMISGSRSFCVLYVLTFVSAMYAYTSSAPANSNMPAAIASGPPAPPEFAVFLVAVAEADADVLVLLLPKVFDGFCCVKLPQFNLVPLAACRTTDRLPK